MKALLLDLDRTLVDVETYVDYCEALTDMQRSFPDSVRGETPETTGWGSCTKVVIATLVGLAGTSDYPEAAALVAGYELAGAPRSQPMPGLRAFLEATADHSRAIVTLVGPEATDLILERHDIAVDAVVPRLPDLMPKPFPDQVEEGLRRLGASAETATMIGDSATDLMAARAAGVRFVAVTNGRDTQEFAGVPSAVDLREARLKL